MPNAVSGVVRALLRARAPRAGQESGHDRPATALRIQRRAVRLARHVADAITPTPLARHEIVAREARRPRRQRSAVRRSQGISSARRRLVRRRVLVRLTSDRTLPVAVALIVLVAAGISLAPAQPVGAAQGEQQPIRLAIGGGAAHAGALVDDGAMPTAEAPDFLDDGTIYKPVAVDTTIQTSADKLRHYTVRQGDTLTSIASRFGVSMMTVWWANKLTSAASVHAGQDLVIPPVNGLVVTVAQGDTLDSVAAKYKVAQEDIIAFNDLQDPILIVGQVLVLPGATGDPIATPTPTSRPRTGTSSSGTGRAPTYTGGAWAWPVVGGGNYISQYFHYGHLGVDIAASYGTKIVAPLSGKVVFAGWKSNGGGYQVWISHGNGIYTGSHHMSSVTVSTGQWVDKGQQVGRVGQSGWATGPHDHFEVWIGFPWESGSYRVNPLRYF